MGRVDKIIRTELLRAFEEMGERYPDWRFGQMVANTTNFAGKASLSGVWDVEDDELLAALKKHLQKPN